MKVRVKADSAYYYPDIVVTCSETDLGSDAPKGHVEAPVSVAAVLSDSTEPVDRREKLLSYRRLESLREYVLIDQNKAWVGRSECGDGGVAFGCWVVVLPTSWRNVGRPADLID